MEYSAVGKPNCIAAMRNITMLIPKMISLIVKLMRFPVYKCKHLNTIQRTAAPYSQPHTNTHKYTAEYRDQQFILCHFRIWHIKQAKPEPQ